MDQRAVANLAEMTEASNAINLLKKQLAEANKNINNWKVEFEVQVQPNNGKYDIEIKASAGGKITTQIISQEEVLYFVDDIHSLTLGVSRRLLLELLTDIAMLDLGPTLTKAIANVEKLASNKGSF